MKLSQAGSALAISVALLSASGCGVINDIRAKNQLNDGARAYGAGHFPEAQQHFERALELNPNQKNAPFFVARAIHAQFKPGVDTPENMQKATDAINAYQKVLEADPKNDEAYAAVASLYASLKQDEKQRDWITKRAEDASIPNEKRSEAYTVLAGQDGTCSSSITELPANKQVVQKEGKAFVQFKKPKDQKDFDQAMQCATRGLEYADKALQLDPNNDKAMSWKTNLLREMAKLAEMDGNTAKKDDYTKQAEQAQQQANELNEKKNKEEAQKAQATAAK